jgi:hypothetical protein
MRLRASLVRRGGSLRVSGRGLGVLPGLARALASQGFLDRGEPALQTLEPPRELRPGLLASPRELRSRLLAAAGELLPGVASEAGDLVHQLTGPVLGARRRPGGCLQRPLDRVPERVANTALFRGPPLAGSFGALWQAASLST